MLNPDDLSVGDREIGDSPVVDHLEDLGRVIWGEELLAWGVDVIATVVAEAPADVEHENVRIDRPLAVATLGACVIEGGNR
ncbi:MAG: hypothetical protein U0R71_17540 [Solirubrobacterales bacterium]